jgi:hypothetical protein
MRLNTYNYLIRIYNYLFRINNKYKKVLNILFISSKFIIITLSLLFLFTKINQEFDNISKIIELNYNKLLFVFFLGFILLNLLNLRFYYFLRIVFVYSQNFLNWSRLFFLTSVLNLALFGTGHALRALELKKREISFRKYFCIYYVLMIMTLFINLFLVTMQYIFVTKEIKSNLPLIIYIFFFIIFFFLISYSRFINFFLKIIKNIKKISRLFLVQNFILTYDLIINIVQNKKNNITFCIYTILIHLLELLIFFIIFFIFLNTMDYEVILLLFSLSFILNNTPFISSLPGLNEIIFGYLSTAYGLFFLDGALIQLLLRLNIYVSVFLNLFFFYFLKIFKSDKL